MIAFLFLTFVAPVPRPDLLEERPLAWTAGRDGLHLLACWGARSSNDARDFRVRARRERIARRRIVAARSFVVRLLRVLRDRIRTNATTIAAFVDSYVDDRMTNESTQYLSNASIRNRIVVRSNRVENRATRRCVAALRDFTNRVYHTRFGVRSDESRVRINARFALRAFRRFANDCVVRLDRVRRFVRRFVRRHCKYLVSFVSFRSIPFIERTHYGEYFERTQTKNARIRTTTKKKKKLRRYDTPRFVL